MVNCYLEWMVTGKEAQAFDVNVPVHAELSINGS